MDSIILMAVLLCGLFRVLVKDRFYSFVKKSRNYVLYTLKTAETHLIFD